jgi:hypothetical protein
MLRKLQSGMCESMGLHFSVCISGLEEKFSTSLWIPSLITGGVGIVKALPLLGRKQQRH